MYPNSIGIIWGDREIPSGPSFYSVIRFTLLPPSTDSLEQLLHPKCSHFLNHTPFPTHPHATLEIFFSYGRRVCPCQDLLSAISTISASV